jgi:hypothetical protein
MTHNDKRANIPTEELRDIVEISDPWDAKNTIRAMMSGMENANLPLLRK